MWSSTIVLLCWTSVICVVAGNKWERNEAQKQMHKDTAEHNAEQLWQQENVDKWTQKMLKQQSHASKPQLPETERQTLLKNTQQRRQANMKPWESAVEELAEEKTVVNEEVKATGFDWRQRIRNNLDTDKDFDWKSAASHGQAARPQTARSPLEDMTNLLKQVGKPKVKTDNEFKRNQRHLVKMSD